MPHFLSPVLRDPLVPWGLRVGGREAWLATRLEHAFEPGRRNRGLLGRRSLSPGMALVLAPCSAVHTWFMRFDIDVVFCDRAGRVCKTVRRLRPWRMAGVWRHGFAVIELASGTAELPDAGQMVELAIVSHEDEGSSAKGQNYVIQSADDR